MPNMQRTPTQPPGWVSRTRTFLVVGPLVAACLVASTLIVLWGGWPGALYVGSAVGLTVLLGGGAFDE